MKTVLITGASGFVGSNLVPHLQESGAAIMTLKHDEDLINIPPSIDAIIHLAGKAHDLKHGGKWEDYLSANYEYTKRLYDAFLVSNAKVFIFTSTVKAAADHFDGVLSEDHVPDPKTFYGQSKLLAEEYIQNKTLPENKKYYILRPCMIHGPGNKGNLNLLYNLISKNIPYPLASFENKRSFLSVDNLCSIIQDLLDSEIAGGIYNVADDEPLSTNEVVSLLAEATHKQPNFLHVPKNIITGIAKAGNFLNLPLNTERLEKLTEDYVVSNKKIKESLHKDLPLSAREGIIRTAKSFLNP